jgi:acyl-CoA synthetase (NDP forming)
MWGRDEIQIEVVMSRIEKMGRLLAPKSIAFIGGRIAEMAIEKCQSIGFEGEIWPVHPNRTKVAGFACFPSIDTLPSVPDAAYVGVNRNLTVEVVGGLSRMGVGGAVCYAAGFSDMGEAGKQIQQALVAAAGDMPVVGPNCFGLINFLDRTALWPYPFGGTPRGSGVALISQSGNIAMNLTMNLRSVRFSYVIGAGNQAVLGLSDYLEVLLNDERVTAIGMYIEGINDLGAFCKAAARAVEQRVPIVVMKVGKTEASAKQSSTHTDSLTGSDELHDALFKRLGIIRVDSLNRLLETLKALELSPVLAGRTIFSLSCSGGEAAIIADLVPEFDLHMPAFSERQMSDLQSQFTDYVTVSNPFDYNTSIWGDQRAQQRCFTSSMQGTHDAAILIYDHPTVEWAGVDEWIMALDAFIAAHKSTGKPAFVICTISELLPLEIQERLINHGVVPLQGLNDGLSAIGNTASYHEFQRLKMQSMTLPKFAGTAIQQPSRFLDEYTAKQQLRSFGICVPEGALASAENAIAVADKLGYPVVVKAVGEQFLHKSDIGVLLLNLINADEVNEAVTRITRNIAAAGLETPEKFLIEKMVSDVVAEVIVGIKRDQQFGLALVIGSGGIFVELIKDSVSLLLPTDEKSIVDALSSLALQKLLDGYRGKPSGDMAALVAAISAFARYAETHWDTLLEADINPLMVLAEGSGAVAADALIHLAD